MAPTLVTPMAPKHPPFDEVACPQPTVPERKLQKPSISIPLKYVERQEFDNWI